MVREMTPESLYEIAKSGNWDRALSAMAGKAELAGACSRYSKPSSGWTFLHQAAHFGNERAVRALVSLGADLRGRSNDGESPSDIARRRGHSALATCMDAATPDELWAPPRGLDVRASSWMWEDAEPRRALLGLRVQYGGTIIELPPGSRYYVDSFERVLVGWHGTFDPPCGMDGEPMIDMRGGAARP